MSPDRNLDDIIEFSLVVSKLKEMSITTVEGFANMVNEFRERTPTMCEMLGITGRELIWLYGIAYQCTPPEERSIYTKTLDYLPLGQDAPE